MKKNLLAKYQKYSKLWKSSVPSEWLRTEEKNHDFSAKQVRTLLALITPTLTGVIFRDMALKGPVLHVRLWEFDREQLKNNAHKQTGVKLCLV